MSSRFDAIHIRYANPEAHISHILSSRALWHGEKPLPVLAAGQFVLKKENPCASSSKKRQSKK